MNNKHHNRSSSHGGKHASRSSKPPALHRRGQSYNHLPAHGQPGNHALRPTLGGARRVITEVTSQDEDAVDEMVGFLQFCATCEKQILTPGNSVLYCSEACRRRDITVPTPPTSQTSIAPSSSYFDFPAPNIVPQRSPTVVRPLSLTFADLTLSDTSSHDSVGSSDQIASDEATQAMELHSTALRPQSNRHSTAFEVGMPSLSNTPSSSIGTAASWSSYRPLPPRHDPSTGHYPHKSIDLVIPAFPTTAPSSPSELLRDSSLKSSASTMTSFRVAEAGNVSFDRRRPSDRTVDQTSSSLKQLLAEDARKSGPTGS